MYYHNLPLGIVNSESGCEKNIPENGAWDLLFPSTSFFQYLV